ncbi:hypothetical protein [Dyella sp. C11]|uniref:hypothetical protein n=1 Tax=Dyella sp. C11 TaxID=2126991 RepID=UPI00130039FF|nr:hypothetical protein [Dyella sp. C11]
MVLSTRKLCAPLLLALLATAGCSHSDEDANTAPPAPASSAAPSPAIPATTPAASSSAMTPAPAYPQSAPAPAPATTSP